MKIVIKHNQKSNVNGLNMESKSKLTPDELKGCLKDDCQFIIRDNEILVGIMDKN